MRRGAVQLLARALARGEALLPAGAAGRLAQPTGGAAALLARRAFADEAALLKTPLYEYHVAAGGAGRRVLLFEMSCLSACTCCHQGCDRGIEERCRAACSSGRRV
jgi:hypothetical protein